MAQWEIMTHVLGSAYILYAHAIDRAGAPYRGFGPFTRSLDFAWEETWRRRRVMRTFSAGDERGAVELVVVGLPGYP